MYDCKLIYGVNVLMLRTVIQFFFIFFLFFFSFLNWLLSTWKPPFYINSYYDVCVFCICVFCTRLFYYQCLKTEKYYVYYMIRDMTICAVHLLKFITQLLKSVKCLQTEKNVKVTNFILILRSLISVCFT
jgi:hypothetical protein